jgi:hypothetical protein
MRETKLRETIGVEEYQLGNRSFNDAWGTIEDYRMVISKGLKRVCGGCDHQPFDSNLPTGLRRRGTVPGGAGEAPSMEQGQLRSAATAPNGENTTAVATPQDTTAAPNSSDKTPVQTSGSLNIPRNTILSLELMTPLSTEATQRNDPFKARVTDPKEFADYIVEGRVLDVKRPGRLRSRTASALF